MTHKKIILASASPRRKKILKLAGLKFKAISSNLNEDLLIKQHKKKGFKNLVKVLSLAKALNIQRTITLNDNEIIIAFDTIVVCKNKILGKPKNKKDALNKLLFLSNKEHKVYTGNCIVTKQITKTDCEVTKVFMKPITKQEALNYINTGEPLDKAGAYGIQGKGKKFVKKISGDYYNVVGLPLKRFLLLLKKLK